MRVVINNITSKTKISPKKDPLEIKGYTTPTLVESESVKHLVAKKTVEEKSVKLVSNLDNFEQGQKDGSFFYHDDELEKLNFQYKNSKSEDNSFNNSN